ncbi:hypothetical protein GEMRC1_012811 [Eukaryota sp. GEM-RC1]
MVPPATTTSSAEIMEIIERVKQETSEALERGEVGTEPVGVEPRPIEDVTFDSIKAAYPKLLAANAIDPTYVSKSRNYSRQFGSDIYLMFDNLQRTGSFKVRGSANFAYRHVEQHGKPDCLVAASAGNHAQGVASISTKLGIPSEIVVPMYAPETKIQSCRALGANIIKYGNSIEQSMKYAKELVRRLDKALPMELF